MTDHVVTSFQNGEYFAMGVWAVVGVITFLSVTVWRVTTLFIKKEYTMVAAELDKIKTRIDQNSVKIGSIHQRTEDVATKQIFLEQNHLNTSARVDKVELKLDNISDKMHEGFNEIKDILFNHFREK